MTEKNKKSASDYFVRDGAIYWQSDHDLVRLSNFTAKIVEDVVFEQFFDGEIVTGRYFVIKGSLGRAQVAANQFDSMRWVTPQWGSRALIEPGHRQHLANAIKSLSKKSQTQTQDSE